MVTIDSYGSYTNTGKINGTDFSAYGAIIVNENGEITDGNSIIFGVFTNDYLMGIETYTTHITAANSELLRILLRRNKQVTFGADSIEGRWRYHGLATGDLPVRKPGWFYGDFTFDSTGALTNASEIINSTDNNDYVPSLGGAVNISADGQISLAGGVAVGYLNDEKDLFLTVGDYCPGNSGDVCGHNLVVYQKQDTTSFSQKDLAGKWYVQALVSGDSSYAEFIGWYHGTFIADANGTGTLNITTSNDNTYIKQASLNLSQTGVLTGAWGNDMRMHGVMSGSKALTTTVYNDDRGGHTLLILIKIDNIAEPDVNSLLPVISLLLNE